MMKKQLRESIVNFSKRKEEHIQIALQEKHQTSSLSGFDTINLIHEALPDINFSDVSIETNCLDHILPSPFIVSSMTAGHTQGKKINHNIAKACTETQWLMGVGSQRRQLFDSDATLEWIELRKKYPDVRLLGNIGIAQLITTSTDKIRQLLEPIQAEAIFVHTNPLQECIQPKGTTDYKGSLKALENLCNNLEIPVILKETGCGFSTKTLKRINNIGLYAVDISGLGGTHWGRIEGTRATDYPQQQQAAEVLADWGISTVDSLLNAMSLDLDYDIWGSGGVRTGLDAAKLLALEAKMIGLAKPILVQAVKNPDAIIEYMQQVEFELKTALFCTGNIDIKSLQENKSWEKNPR